MAGLIRLKDPKKAPLFPRPDTSLSFWSGMGNGVGTYYYFPGFSGGTAGRSIGRPFNNTTGNVYQYNADGSEVTDGVWNGGMTIDEASGYGETDKWVNFFMDDADNKLYIVTQDTGTSPNTIYTSSVNEAGTVTEIGNAQLGNASFNSLDYFGVYGPSMSRAGGDGSGDIVLTNVQSAGGNAAAGVPYRGVKITVSLSNGSLTYSNLLGSTFSTTQQVLYGYGLVGPTANNIIWITYFPQVTSNPSAGQNGQLINTSTGKFVAYALFGIANEMPWGASAINTARWRGRYFFPNRSSIYGKSNAPYLEADVHNWVDEMAVYYGIL